MIGIKIASGEFYPIMAEGGRSAKRLILTTIRDNQEKVHIDLYRCADGTLEEEGFIGRLIIDGISPKPKRGPEIELALSLDESLTLTARAIDLETNKRKSVRVSMGEPRTEEAEEFTVPDFELSEPEAFSPPDLGESPLVMPSFQSEAEQKEEPPEAEGTEYAAFVPPLTEKPEIKISQETTYKEMAEKKPFPLWIIIIVLAAIAALLLLFLFVYKLGENQGSKRLAQAPSPIAVATSTVEPSLAPTASPTVEPTLEPTFEATLEAIATPEITLEPTLTPSPTPLKKAVGKNGSKGVTHKIRWGDTLWDISIRYYGTPWMYKKIARANKIKNPDLIISGRKLWIPPR
jgi:nucleoid-associated protein YgaU